MILLAVTMGLFSGLTESRHILVAPAESIHVELAGPADAPAVVIIPGLFGSAFGFRHVIPLLVDAGFRVVVVEPLAIGGSGRPPRADYSSTAQAGRIGAVLDSLGVNHALMIAHSMAASEVFRLAYRRPDLVAGMLSLESGPAETVGSAGFRNMMRFAPLMNVLGVGVVRDKIRGELIAASGDSRWVTEDVVRGYTAAAAEDLGGTLKAFNAMAKVREPELLAPHLPEIQVPVLLLIGTARHQGTVKPDEIDRMRTLLPAFSMDTVSGVGHYIQEERPQAVFDALQRLHLLVGRAPALETTLRQAGRRREDGCNIGANSSSAESHATSQSCCLGLRPLRCPVSSQAIVHHPSLRTGAFLHHVLRGPPAGPHDQVGRPRDYPDGELGDA